MAGGELEQHISNSSERTKRAVNLGAESWINNPINVLDHGFLTLIDYMGDDEAVDGAARISYRSGTRQVSQTEGLIRYLRRNRHTSPFEMAVMKFHAKMPIVVARQWVRHRTASINEESARYSILSSEFYIPEEANIAMQSAQNRQGRGDSVDIGYAQGFREALIKQSADVYELYEYYLNDNEDTPDPERPQIAREIARLPLGVNIYTQWIWTCNLHNIFHFLRLRTDEHAQWEIRQYANAMATIVNDAFPISFKAFNDYELKSKSLSKPEQDVFGTLMSERGVSFTKEEVQRAANIAGLTNKRELNEFINKLEDLNLLNFE